MVVWGASGHAIVVIDLLLATGGYDIAGVVDDATDRPDEVLRYPVVGGRDRLAALWDAGARHLVVAVGGLGAAVAQQRRIGAGSVVGAGVVVVADVPDATVVVGSPARPIPPKPLR